MSTFIDTVVEDLTQKEQDLSQCIFVLPTKRASVFLRKSISKHLQQPIFSPDIFSIEEFVQNISGLKSIGNTQLVFEFYSVYKEYTPAEAIEPFDQFLSWAPTVIQDFNEIDRFLVEPKSIFNYLKAINDLEHWSLSEDKSDLMIRHLDFTSRLYNYYLKLNERLLANNSCYQGMAYRQAVDQLEYYISNNEDKHHVFFGFNALNKAESSIIQELLELGLASIYWDTDETFHNDTQHSAGLYTRQFKDDWLYFRRHPFNWIGKNYSQSKQIKVTGIPKQVGQAKYVGQLIKELMKNNIDLSKTAVVLGDENLLIPLLNSIPEDIPAVNITMGLPLKQSPLSSMFEYLFRLHRTQKTHYYFKDLIALIDHPFIKPLFSSGQLIKAIHKHNKVYTSLEWLLKQDPANSELIELLCTNWNNTPDKALETCQNLIRFIKVADDNSSTLSEIDLEYLFKFYTLFNTLSTLHSDFNHFSSIESLQKIYRELLNSETLDFKGEPLEGLQIMGMLESRTLDFETLIITSVNEGILPAGKTQNSVLPYDVKIQYELPTYKEKDAVYTYHFYRLLQRAKSIYIVYNTEIDVLKGGEKSRFITQLEVENIHPISHEVISPEVILNTVQTRTIDKNSEIDNKIRHLGTYGFSPSALSTYVRNPIDFYYRYVLGIKESEEVEEHLAANTMGTILHETLEALYKPFIGEVLSEKGLNSALNKRDSILEQMFNEHYGIGNFESGKNLIAFEVAKRYIHNFIQLEIKSVKNGDAISIIGLEQQAKVPILIEALKETFYLKGTVDRIDSFNGMLRIIDYKSGKVTASQVHISNWEDLTTDYGKSKALQLLCYAYMYSKSNNISLPLTAGIISFKNMKSGVLSFGTKSSARSKTVNSLITEETLLEFEKWVTTLILELMDTKVPFIEKEIK